MKARLEYVLSLLSQKERKQVYWLSAMTVAMALVEVAGVASIIPFMAVLGNAGLIETNVYLAAVYQYMGFQTTQQFLIFLGICVLIILVTSIAFTALTNWMLLKFTHMRIQSVSERLLVQYLHRPYSFFLNQNSADLIRKILTEVSQVVSGVIIPGLDFVARTMAVVFIFALLLVADTRLALIVALVLGGAYLAIYMFVRRKLNSIGKKRVAANEHRFKAAHEAFGGIKDIKLLGKESVYVDMYSKPSIQFARYQALRQLIAQLPKYAIQALAFAGMMIIILYLLSVTDTVGEVLPLMGLYVVAGYRLMPSLQQMFADMTKIRFSMPALDSLYEDLEEGSEYLHKTPEMIRTNELLMLNDEIRFSGLSFRYPKATNDTLKSLDISIKSNTTVGFAGSTGSGKTTAIDLILGLLTPTKGHVLVDGVPLGKGNIRHWQNNLGYVPQHIYLSDDTITRNIAFGIDNSEIDQDAVEMAAKIANLHGFIVGELEDGYQTMVGERGIRLSGGQRQRIGIARALYYDPAVLVFDEATSALDNATEHEVMQAIRNVAHKKTIILVAHRLTTLMDCDEIYVMEAGRLKERGNYEKLMKGSDLFRNMAYASAEETRT